MNNNGEGLTPLDARQGEDVGASVVPDSGAVGSIPRHAVIDALEAMLLHSRVADSGRRDEWDLRAERKARAVISFLKLSQPDAKPRVKAMTHEQQKQAAIDALLVPLTDAEAKNLATNLRFLTAELLAQNAHGLLIDLDRLTRYVIALPSSVSETDRPSVITDPATSPHTD